MKDGKEIRYFSMFTGVGGFELGFENAGSKSNLQGRWNENSRSTQDLQDNRSESSDETISFSCVGMSEIDKYASELLSKRFPGVKNYGDCTKINPRELPDFDLLCGGFPCQSFSIAGKRRGFEDTRGTMFFEIARILEVKRPKTVLLENVKGLLNHNKGETFRVILQTLDELGYETQWMVLNSKFFGVPQNRERVFIIGNIRGERRSEILPFRESDQNINEESSEIYQCHSARYYKGANGTHIKQLNNPTHSNNRIYSEEGISPSLNTAQGGNRQPKIRAVLTPDRAEKRKNGRRFKEQGEPSFTLTKQDIHGVAIIRGRPIMPYEKGKRELKYTRYEDTCPTLSQNCASGDQKNMVAIVKPKVVKMIEQTCKKRTFETPKEINEFLRANKGLWKIKEIAFNLELPKTQVEHYFRTDKSRAVPSPKIWMELKELLFFEDDYDKQVTEVYEKEIEFEQTRRVWDTTCSPTLNATQPHLINTMKIRRLTPTECERLQGFPEGWTLYRKVYKLVKLYGNIWKDVQLKDVEDQFVIRDQNYVLNITKGGKDGETPTLSIQAKEEMEENVVLRGVIEIHTVEDGVCDITNLGKDMVMLYKAKGTPNYEEITNQNLIKEKMEEQSIFPLWKITLEEKLKKEKLSTILTLIKKTILSKTFTCVKTGKPITNAIIVWKRLEQNSLEEESLNLRMENTLLNSDTQRYKMMGNAVTVNVIKALGEKLI